MLRILWLGILFAIFGAGVASAAEELYAPARGELEYRLSNGRTVEMAYLDASTMRRSDGVVVHVDQWGNQLRRTGSNPVTFKPHNGQLPEAPLEIGLRWEHRYHLKNKSESYWRERECRVVARGQLTIGAGTFQNAWKVECTNQRTDRPLPKNEVTWYSSQGRVLLHHREWWGGSNPGSFEVELVGLSMEPQAVIIGALAQ